VPVVATYHLHANVSDDNVALVNAFIGYKDRPGKQGRRFTRVRRRLVP
jgi:microcystin degradation protein MlrC